MFRAILTFGALVCFAGCSNKEAVDAANAMADAVCACKSLTCAQEMTEKHNDQIEKFKDARGTEDDSDKIKAAGKRAQKCITRLRDKAKEG